MDIQVTAKVESAFDTFVPWYESNSCLAQRTFLSEQFDSRLKKVTVELFAAWWHLLKKGRRIYVGVVLCIYIYSHLGRIYAHTMCMSTSE